MHRPGDPSLTTISFSNWLQAGSSTAATMARSCCPMVTVEGGADTAGIGPRQGPGSAGWRSPRHRADPRCRSPLRSTRTIIARILLALDGGPIASRRGDPGDWPWSDTLKSGRRGGPDRARRRSRHPADRGSPRPLRRPRHRKAFAFSVDPQGASRRPQRVRPFRLHRRCSDRRSSPGWHGKTGGRLARKRETDDRP